MNKLASRVLVSLALLIIVISIASPLTAIADTYPQNVSGNVIKIGMSISLTGKFATEGKQALCGVKAAIDYFNNNGGVTVNGNTYKLQLYYYDDQSDKNQVTSLYSKLITSDNVDFLLAPYSSGLTAAAAPLAEQYKKVMLSHGGASDSIFQQGYKYVAQILAPASKYFASTLEMLKEYQNKVGDIKIAFIYEDNAFANAVMNGAAKEAQKLGLDVVYTNKYQKGTTDFSSFISAAKAKGANVLIGGGHFEDGKALVSQAHNLGWNLKFIGILVAPAQPQFYDELKDVANGVAYPAQWDVSLNYSPDTAKKLGLTWFGPTKDEWLNYFKQECPDIEKPAYQAAEAGAAIVFLVKAIETANSLDSTAVRQAMNNLDLMTFFGHLKIDPQTGLQVGHKMVVVQWQNGQQIVIYPKEVAHAEPLFMAPAWWTQTTTQTTSSPTQTSTATSSPTASSPTQTTTTQKKSNAALWAAVIIIIIIIVGAAWWAMKK
ncbi:MAG: amino acid ABC transporter substrate-binding protein [Desulfurococcales archaeon]|nr:amino acid ABC transporter substrate-binding protein [Desulfurococcales archaeon]